MKIVIRAASVFAAAALLTAVVALPASAAHLANPNRLANPGFEDDIEDTTDPFVGRWHPFFSGEASSDDTTTMPLDDLQSLELNIEVADRFAGAFQDVPINPARAGDMWWFSGWHKAAGQPANNAPEIRIEFLNSTGGEISRPQITPAAGDNVYEEFVHAGTVPAGATIARVVYATASFGNPSPQQVFVDRTNFNLVPEPTALALAGLAGLVIAGVRRRV